MGEFRKKATKIIGTVFLCMVAGYIVLNVFYVLNRKVPVVKRVVDGDSLVLDDGREVRLIGIDTPEMQLDQPFAREAKEYLKKLVLGKKVLLQEGSYPKDNHDRYLFYVYIHGTETMVNIDLLREGLAYAYFVDDDIKYPDQFIEAQQSARKKKKGLWSLPVKKREKKYYVSFGLTHRPGCKKMKRWKKAKKEYKTREEALDTGSPPCRTCRP